jgi:hypothetical protein
LSFATTKSENARLASNPFVYVYVVAEPLTTSLFVYAQQIVYDAIPELSFDASHASDTVYGVRPVIRRLAGVVGAALSRAPKAGDEPTTIMWIRAETTVPAASNARFPDVLAPPDHARAPLKESPSIRRRRSAG